MTKNNNCIVPFFMIMFYIINFYLKYINNGNILVTNLDIIN